MTRSTRSRNQDQGQDHKSERLWVAPWDQSRTRDMLILTETKSVPGGGPAPKKGAGLQNVVGNKLS